MQSLYLANNYLQTVHYAFKFCSDVDSGCHQHLPINLQSSALVCVQDVTWSPQHCL